MFNFDGGVVGELRMLGVKGFDDARGVGDAVKKIGITEGDVFGAGLHLLANVRQDDFLRDDAKLAVVNRDDGAMAAEVFAAARGFGVTGGAMLAGRENDVRVFFQGRKAGSVGNFKSEARKFCGERFDVAIRIARGKCIREL